MVDVLAPQPHQARVADFAHAGKRIVVFLADDGPGAKAWPQVAERYAAEHGLGLADARWYEVRPMRFTNGRPHVSEYLVNERSWKFETNLDLAREIVQRLGFDPDNLPLDL